MNNTHELEAKIDALLDIEKERLAEKRENAKALFAQISEITDDLESRKRIYSKYQQLIDIGAMPENTLRGILSKGWNLSGFASFRSLVALDSCRRKAAKCYSAWPLNDKANAVKFTDKLSVPRPKIFQTAVPVDEISIPQYPCIIKPLFGATSHGVHIAFTPNKFKMVRNGVMVDSLDKVKEKLRGALKSKVVSKDVWQVEELIADVDGDAVRAARDLKFYCFYGKVGMVLEVEREKGAKFRTWLPNGKLAHAAEFTETHDFAVTKFGENELRLVERISKEIPVPFVSIDFLKTDDRMVFCEFTPRPGVYGKYKPAFDTHLGGIYLAAEARLQKDLVDGKTFSIYHDYLKEIGVK